MVWYGGPRHVIVSQSVALVWHGIVVFGVILFSMHYMVWYGLIWYAIARYGWLGKVF